MSAISAAQKIASQLSNLLDQLTIEQYSQPLSILNGSSIGQHVRHTLEFFTCLFEGAPQGKVDYDGRRRDIFLESNTLEAKNCLVKISDHMDQLDENIDLILIQSYDECSSVEVDSNLFRELVYNIEHAVHHMALIRVGLKEVAPQVQLNEDFGVASSTIKYRKSLESAG